ncbi:MAG: SurA N-terminal domain-containing protein [Nitrospirales bacterium]
MDLNKGTISLPISWNSIVYFSFLLLVILACESGNQVPDYPQADKVMVTVNGHQIYRSEIDRRIKSLSKGLSKSSDDINHEGLIREQAIEAEIIDHLMLGEAKKAGLEVEPNRLDQEYERSRQMMGEDAFDQMLQQRQATEAQYRTFLSEQILISNYRNSLTKDVEISLDKIKQYYDGHHQRFFELPSVRLEVVNAKGFNSASEIEDQLRSGVAWSEIAAFAKQNDSILKATRTRWMPYDAIPKHLEIDVANIPEGKVVLTHVQGSEYMIVRIVEKREGRELPFEDVHDQIRTFLLQREKQRVINEWYMVNAKTADIKYIQN